MFRPCLTQNIITIMKSKFRLNAKKLHLSYSNLDAKTTYGDLLTFLNKELTIEKYFIVFETQSDALKKAHVLLILTKRCCFRDANRLDLQVENKVYPGTYKTAKQVKNNLNYFFETFPDAEYYTNIGDFKNISKTEETSLIKA